MIHIRRSGERGQADHGWLRSFHSFSFGSYRDPRFMRFGNLRVINEDRVEPGAGFPTHSHQDMEIVSYVLEGHLAHRDSLGNVVTVPAGEVQRMSAGSGVTHSEFNPSSDTPAHFLQIWVEPIRRGIEPGYEQRPLDRADRRGRLRPIATPEAREDALYLHADAVIHAGLFDGDERDELPLRQGRLAYVHVVRGALEVNGHALTAGDAAMLESEPRVELRAGRSAEVLVFDLAP